MEKQHLNDLINKAKANNRNKTVQKVVPVKTNTSDEVQFSFYLEKTLLKRLKQNALDNNQSIKKSINRALEIYLKTDT
ncbi:hypothetical protein [Galbibacter mesophilus]|uniref:hypothetical protein n=1 Tax=Galbibacter mesophilus TaxID=379069 RepID=UPI00191D072F|nr:hypothetical protein [Galbibacter mesophilus]MCM5664273.1 hypothetical protein [Galbibacter mesophilus]